MKPGTYTNLLSALVVGGILASCSSATKDKETQLAELKAQHTNIGKQITDLEAEIVKENPSKAEVKARDVVVSALSPRQFDHFVQTQGAVESEENVHVSAKTMGIITHVYVREGESVTKGQILAQIDNTLIMRGIEELESQLRLANTVFERQKNLWDQKIGTEVQYLQARTNKEGLEKRLASMNEQNDMAKIKSPINGIVDAVEVKVGQNIAPGMPAARVVNNTDLKILANVSEAYANRLKKGDKVVIYFPDLSKTFEARLSFVARNIDQLSRSFIAEASLPSSPDLRPNMTAIVKIVYETAPSAIVVPINTVQTINGEKVVYIAEARGAQLIARKKVVTVDGVYGNLAQVNGLADGDKLITVGFQGLNDGEFVKI